MASPSHNRALVAVAALYLSAILAANVRFIGLHNHSLATHGRKGAGTHGFTDALAHEPRRFNGQPENAGKLVAADPLLAAAHQENGLKPDMKLDVAALEYGADRNAGLLAAGVALVEPRPGGFAAHALHALHGAAMRAHGTMRPNYAFQFGVSGGFILEVGGVKDAHAVTLHYVSGFGKYNIAKLFCQWGHGL